MKSSAKIRFSFEKTRIWITDRFTDLTFFLKKLDNSFDFCGYYITFANKTF